MRSGFDPFAVIQGGYNDDKHTAITRNDGCVVAQRRCAHPCVSCHGQSAAVCALKKRCDRVTQQCARLAIVAQAPAKRRNANQQATSAAVFGGVALRASSRIVWHVVGRARPSARLEQDAVTPAVAQYSAMTA